MKRRLMAVIMMLLIAVLPFVLAQVVPPLNLNEGVSERRDLSNLPVQNLSAQAGNITQVNIDVIYVTKSWQGYYGNVTGTITLDDADNNTFYNWTLVTVDAEIFAARASDVQFTTVNCTNSSELATEESYLGQIASDGDSVSNTFNSTDHPELSVGTQTNISGCYSTNSFVDGEFSHTDFHQLLLSDDSSNLVYTAITDDNQLGFDGNTYDFQMLVGENGHNGDTATTTYYFWVEIN